jgi:hypothetical protein
MRVLGAAPLAGEHVVGAVGDDRGAVAVEVVYDFHVVVVFSSRCDLVHDALELDRVGLDEEDLGGQDVLGG